MKTILLPLALGLSLPCVAAPHPVAITLKNTDGLPLSGKTTLALIGPQNLYQRETATDGKTRTLSLEPGFYSLRLWSNGNNKLPSKVWHGLAVSSDAKDLTTWDLKVPLTATLQGKILLPDGKPAVGCLVAVQSGTNQGLSRELAPQVTKEPRIALELMDRIALGAQNAYAATRTDESGAFSLQGLAPANYAVDVFYAPLQKWFTIPFAPALEGDAKKGEPTKIGAWTVPDNGWNWLFDSKLQHGGAESKYTGQGKVSFSPGVVRLGVGDDMTGINWPDLDKEKLPKLDYELSFDARRVEGNDFFTGLTFPWGDKPISWIVGGWGGRVVGLSNVNGFSAVENETTRAMDFEDQRWYRLRLRVTKPKIEAWIDDEKVINLPTMDKEFTIRWSVEPSQPLGFATWQTGGELRDIRIRALEKSEIAAIEKSVQE